MSDVCIKSGLQVLHVDDSRIRVSSAGTLSSKEPELRGMTKLNAEKSTELSFCKFSWLGVVNFVNEKSTQSVVVEQADTLKSNERHICIS
jgi:hypothetical protein